MFPINVASPLIYCRYHKNSFCCLFVNAYNTIPVVLAYYSVRRVSIIIYANAFYGVNVNLKKTKEKKLDKWNVKKP